MLIVNIFVVIFILDFIFIYLSKQIFNRQVSIIQNTPLKLNYSSALLCYGIIVFVLYWFILKQNKSHIDAFILGSSIYAIYELTNMSIFEKWEYKTVIIDSIWGGVLFGLTTYILSKPLDISNVHPAYIS
jgi:uncharacterized membrane protein